MKLVILIFFILIFILLYYNYKKTNITYYKNDIYILNKILSDVFKKNNFIRNNKKYKTNIYIPDTYTFIDIELHDYKIKDKEQYIFGFDSCDILAGKNNLWNLLENKYGRKKTKYHA